MIGRANELTLLQSTINTVCEHGDSRVALVTGQAGLGKSRLVQELRGNIAPVGVPHTVVAGSQLRWKLHQVGALPAQSVVDVYGTTGTRPGR